MEPLIPPTKSQCSPTSIVTAVRPQLNKNEHSNRPDESSYSYYTKELNIIRRIINLGDADLHV